MDLSIRDRWSKPLARVLAACLLGTLALPAQTLEGLAREYRLHPTPAHHGALLRYANAHPNDPNGALALFSLGVTEAGLGPSKQGDAVQHLKAVRSRLPKLADYVGYELALTESDQKQFGTIQGDLFPVWNHQVPSPLVAKSALLAAGADLQTGNPAAGVELLRRYYNQIPQPEGDLLLAGSYEAAHDAASAAVYYQRVYYQHPASQQGDLAAQALARLRGTLGGSYPPPTANLMLERAGKLLSANLHARARNEYQSLVLQLAGTDRDLARVGIGAADFETGNSAEACRYLKSLQLAASEADAERLYYLAECARRSDNHSEMHAFLDQLGKQYPNSKWRLKALVTAGNHYVLTNEWNLYLPLFRVAYQAFPSDPQADYCHWKVTWNAYLNRRPEAMDLLREHLSRFPASPYSAGSLYFMGRAHEATQDFATAKALYERITRSFPGYYYSGLAEDRLRDRAFSDVFPSQATRSLLEGIALRTPVAAVSFEPNGISRLRIERAHLLATAALDDLADQELRFGAATGDQPHVLAMELAQMVAKRGTPDRAIRLIKTLVPDYFTTAFEAPRRFWELAFPLPFRASLVRYAKERNLDPYLVAGLIRQESEFNPKAVSPAQAYGLTQVMPSTGRQLSKKLGVRRFRTSTLLQPDINLKFGTYYLKSLLDGNGGKVPQTLASYNAGGSRVASWMSWGDFREPAEFVETIPFSETRNYVQSVMRNAAAYRHLYGPEPPKVTSSDGVPAKKPGPAVAKKSTKRKNRAVR